MIVPTCDNGCQIRDCVRVAKVRLNDGHWVCYECADELHQEAMNNGHGLKCACDECMLVPIGFGL